MTTSYPINALSLSKKAKVEALEILKQLGAEVKGMKKHHVPEMGYVLYFKDAASKNVAYLHKTRKGMELLVN